MRAPRYSLHLPVRYRLVGETAWREGMTENISRSGVFFRATGVLDVDAPIEMRLALPLGPPPAVGSEVLCSGRIVRTVVSSTPELRPGLAATITRYQLLPGTPDTKES